MGIGADSTKETEENKVCDPVVDFPKHLGVIEDNIIISKSSSCP